MKMQLSQWARNNGKTIAKVVGAILLVILIVDYVIQAKNKAKYERDIAEWKARSEQILAQNDSIRSVVKVLEYRADSVNTVANSYSTEITRLRKVANRPPRVIIEDLEAALPEVCQACIDALTVEHARSDSLNVALDLAEQRDTLRVASIDSLSKGNGLLLQMNDSLTKLVIAVPIYKAPKLLGFIPYPSRKASFVSGAVIGVTSVFVVRHNIR